MGLEEEPVAAQRHLQEFRQLLIPRIGMDARTQDEEVGIDDELFLQDGVEEGNLDQTIPALDGLNDEFGFLILIVPDESHSLLACLSVHYLHHPVRSDVAVENMDIRIGMAFEQPQGVLHGLGAADAAAVRMLAFAGPHALNHDHGSNRIRRTAAKTFFKIFLCNDIGMSAVQVFRRFVFCCPGGYDDDSVRDLHDLSFHPFRFCLDPRLVIPDEPVNLPNIDRQVDMDQWMIRHLLDERPDVLLNIVPIDVIINVPRMTAQFLVLLDDEHFESLLGQVQRGHHPGHASADDEALLRDKSRHGPQWLD